MTWVWHRLGDLLTPQPNRKVVQQGWSPRCHPEPAPDGHWGVLKTTAIQDGRFEPKHNKLLPDHMTPREMIEVHPGDLLITCAGPRTRCGVPALVRHTRPRLMMSGKMYRIRPNHRVVPEFLELWLRSPEAQGRIDSMKTGISESGLNLTHDRFVQLQVPVPPLDEQRRIVDLLEDHLSRLDAAATYLLAARRRDGVLRDRLLASQLSSVSCVAVALGDLLTVGLSNGKSVPTQDGGFPVLRLTALRDGRIDLRERKGGAWSADDASRFLVARGDFLISRGNGSLRLVGRGGLVTDDPDPVAFPDTLIRARPEPERIVPDYLSLVWNAPVVRRQIEPTARTTAGIYKVNQADLNAIRVPVPSLADQEQVVKFVAASRETLNRLSGQVVRATDRADRLRRSLLTAAFSGRLTGDAAKLSDVGEMIDA